MLDEILEKAGLKYEDLTSTEKETLNTWMEVLQKGQLSLEKVKEYITSMREAVEQELAKAELGTKQDLFLKARLRNYMLLYGFL
jgi:predicted HTH domain antitoxin